MIITSEKIGNLIKIVSGFAFKSERFSLVESGMPLIRIRDVVRGSTNTYYSGKFSKEYVIKNGDILIGMDGEFNIAKWRGPDALLNQRVCKIQSNNPLLLDDYLYYAIPRKLKEIEDRTPFVTVKHLSVKTIKEIEIPLLSLENQKRIVRELDVADKLRQKRKQAIILLDDYLKAEFLEMFGDPVLNTKKWEVNKIEKLIIKITSGTSYKGEEGKTLDSDEMGVLKISAVTRGVFNQNEFKAVKKNLLKMNLVTVQNGDFLFSRANTRELVAASCIADGDYPNLFLPDKLWRISFNDNICNKYFFHYLIKNQKFRDVLTKQATGTSGSMLNISMHKFMETSAITPTIELQNKFEQVCMKTEKLKCSMIAQSQELDANFKALMQSAFKG